MAKFVFTYKNMFTQVEEVEIEAGDEKNAFRILKSRIGRGKITPNAWQNFVSVTEVK